MGESARSLSRGLSTVLVGFWIVLAATVVSAGALAYDGWPPAARIAVLCPALAVGAAGLVVGFVGRRRCLAIPDEWQTARTRLRMAVLLEASALLSVLANFGVGVGLAVTAPRWMSIPALGTGVPLLLLVLGRVMFLRFTRAVAEELGNTLLVRRVATLLVLFVSAIASATIGFALGVAGNWIAPSATSTVAYAICGGLLLAASVVGLIGLTFYARLLGRLREAVLHVTGLNDAENEPAHSPSAPT